jgi:hypothetical protein
LGHSNPALTLVALAGVGVRHLGAVVALAVEDLVMEDLAVEDLGAEALVEVLAAPLARMTLIKAALMPVNYGMNILMWSDVSQQLDTRAQISE